MGEEQSILDGLLPLIGNVTAPTLCGLFVLLIMTGKLVPKNLMLERLKEILDGRDSVIEGKNEVIKEQSRYIVTLETHLGLYARSSNTTEQVVQALQGSTSPDVGSN